MTENEEEQVERLINGVEQEIGLERVKNVALQVELAGAQALVQKLESDLETAIEEKTTIRKTLEARERMHREEIAGIYTGIRQLLCQEDQNNRRTMVPISFLVHAANIGIITGCAGYALNLANWSLVGHASGLFAVVACILAWRWKRGS